LGLRFFAGLALQRILHRSASVATAPEEENSDEAKIISSAISLFHPSIFIDSGFMGPASAPRPDAIRQLAGQRCLDGHQQHLRGQYVYSAPSA
jgi:hypothetical protein